MNNLPTIITKFKEAGGLPQLPKIYNDADFNVASDTYAFLKKYYDIAEKKRKEDVAPLVEEKKQIDNKYKAFTTPVEGMMTEIKKMMVGYSTKQQEAQRLLEAEAIADAVANGDDNVIVDALDVTKNQSEFSSSSLQEITKFRFKISKLNFIEIPIQKFKIYLEDNELPIFIESYKESSLTIRKKF